MISITKIDTALGVLTLAWQEEMVISRIRLPAVENTAVSGRSVPAWLKNLSDAVQAYFGGDSVDFHSVCSYFQPDGHLPSLNGASLTRFRLSVYQAVSAIPTGQALSYGEVATAINNPKAARAIGGAMAANPYPLLVPCHRVLASNGLGGFSGGCGIELKKQMLRLEGIRT